MQTKTALVVDDSRVARMTLGKLLRARGLEPVELGSGEEALAWLAEGDNRPDIIFMDVMMDGMDGLTATRRIRSSPALVSIPVVICTGNDSEADVERAREAGASTMLSKPPAPDALDALLTGLMSPDDATPAPQPEPQPQPQPQSQPQPQPQIDVEALVQQAIRQRLPAIEQQMRQAAEAVSRQVAEQVSSQQRETARAEQDSLSRQLREKLDVQAAQALEQAVERADLPQRLTTLLQESGMQWLQAQQQAVLQGLEQDSDALLRRRLDEQLSQQLAPLVTQQLAESRQHSEARENEQRQALEQRLARQQRIALGALLVAVIAVIVGIIL